MNEEQEELMNSRQAQYDWLDILRDKKNYHQARLRELISGIKLAMQTIEMINQRLHEIGKPKVQREND